MPSNTALNNEKICDLAGQPLDRNSAVLLKALDKLLTVGSYYSPEHDQYRVVSEKSCAQIVAAIGPGKVMAIEITASGMMVGSQLVDPHHRNVRLFHDLLVPLNIARFEISAELTPADLRQAIAALQDHRQNLGNTTGFQEIKIENLPATVSTASKNVVRDNGQGESFSLDTLLGSNAHTGNEPSPEDLMSDSEKLASQFLEIVSRILENLEKEEGKKADGESLPHPDSTPENIKALREALQRLVEVNPDPADLARLIEHAKRALDLSHDPRSVDLVFSLLKKEAEKGGDWKYRAREGSANKPKKEYRFTLEELTREISELETAGRAPDDPGPSSLSSYLGICFHLLGGDPAEALETALELSLMEALTDRGVTKQDLDLCSAAVAAAALKKNQAALDRVLPAFCRPLRKTRPNYLVKFWTGLWEALDTECRELVWPHLVNELMLGFEDIPDEVTEQLWVAVGQLDSRVALTQISRLEGLTALLEKTVCPSLMKLPLNPMYPVHLVLLKSTLAALHGPRVHEHLCHNPPNDLIEILMKSLGQYEPSYNDLFLALIKQSGADSITPELRGRVGRHISRALSRLPASRRKEEWVGRAIGWAYKLDPKIALPLLTRVRDEKKFIFFKAWPRDCREMAAKCLSPVEVSNGVEGEE